MKNKHYPLMKNNILKDDLDNVIKHLKQKDPILTSNINVKKFEKKWSKWLGVRYSVFVNSGSSANLLSLSILKILFPKGGEIIVPPLTWSSDIYSVILNGFKPVFVDIKLENLAMDINLIEKKITKKTVAIFLTHVLGFNALSQELIRLISKKKIILIEDVCESHGASFKNNKLGTFGLMSNFSFYYAHHLTTIEGGMICTNNKKIYNNLRMLRAHGLLRENSDKKYINLVLKKNKSLNKEFIFMYPSYNVRNNEIGAIIGINQINRLNKNIKKRNMNFQIFLKNINKDKYFIDFDCKGMSNYAFVLIQKNKSKTDFIKLTKRLDKANIEYRIGTAGGGNQLRQPYLLKYIKENLKQFKTVEHIHHFSMYIGNYPELSSKNIIHICEIINGEKH